MLNKLRRREQYKIQISEKCKTPTSNLQYEGYFSTTNLNWELMYLFPRVFIVDTKLRIFQYKILNNNFLVNKMLFEFKKVESTVFFLQSRLGNLHILLHWFQYIGLVHSFSTGFNIPSILPQSAIFEFLDDHLENKILLNYMLLSFKNYLCKPR